jgi:hypothetical protein
MLLLRAQSFLDSGPKNPALLLVLTQSAIRIQNLKIVG